MLLNSRSFLTNTGKWVSSPLFFAQIRLEREMADALNRHLIGGANKNSLKLMGIISPLLKPLGFDVIEVEVQTQREKKLRVFIDHLSNGTGNGTTPGKIGVEDCAEASRALNEPLDALEEVEKIFGNGAYSLEVSSPGVDRPLKKVQDFGRFRGKRARIHTVRPLTEEETQNSSYSQLNPKQKNYVGILEKSSEEKIALATEPKEEVVHIPFSLITKAHLEPLIQLDELERKRQ